MFANKPLRLHQKSKKWNHQHPAGWPSTVEIGCFRVEAMLDFLEATKNKHQVWCCFRYSRSGYMIYCVQSLHFSAAKTEASKWDKVSRLRYIDCFMVETNSLKHPCFMVEALQSGSWESQKSFCQKKISCKLTLFSSPLGGWGRVNAWAFSSRKACHLLHDLTQAVQGTTLCSIAPFFGCQDWGVQMRQSVSPKIHWLLHGRSEFFETSMLHGRSFAKRLMGEPKVILPKENLMQTYPLPRPQQRSLTHRGNFRIETWPVEHENAESFLKRE